MKAFLSFFTPGMPGLLTYMLQQYEYDARKFGSWLLGVKDLREVKKRGKPTYTKRFKIMLVLAYGIWLVGLLGAIWLILTLIWWQILLGALLFLQLSTVVGLGLYLCTLILQTGVVNPRQQREIKQAKAKLSHLDIPRIAVLGSYGKTSMKELLLTVLSQGKTVVATPGNKNILISHARWVNKYVSGQEDVLIFEYGEAEPGDIAKLASFSKPTHAVVTGVAPAHLDYYPSLEDVADDFATITKQVPAENLYFNGESDLLKNRLEGHAYNEHSLDGWKVTQTKVSFDGTSFTFTKGKDTLQLKSGLLGLHYVGPLAAAAVLALQLGLNKEQVTEGIATTQAYPHRMQPRYLHGAWIIDDTYNGNIEGMRAGLELLKALPAKRKIYVTPGLVDQGEETENVHNELGVLIAAANPDQVVLMKNSVTQYIQAGLQGYKGQVKIEDNPLEYYTNLEHFLADGDVALLQNDWPDSYK